MTTHSWVFLHGRIIPEQEASISPFDRGFLFAHAAYEVTAVCRGKLVDFDGHLNRLKRTLADIEIENPYSDTEWLNYHLELIKKNEAQEGLVYLQVTAGTYEYRDFAGPGRFQPTVFMFARAKQLVGPGARDGIAAVLVEDQRWARRDLKTTQLISQVLAYRTARRVDASQAILLQDGYVTEAASANVWIVSEDNILKTRALSQAILPGITRARVLDAELSGTIEVIEADISKSELFEATEVFTTSSGALIAPVIAIDGQQVGTGRPGPVTRAVQRAYYRHIGADLTGLDWLED